MAIVAVDVVGYSRLMSHDEDGTLEAWQQVRSLIDPLFTDRGGRIVKSTGDGILVEAPSVIEAVRASIDVQHEVQRWNQGRAEDKEIRLRIGINLGDVVVDETGDIYGNGVNVAARLEGLAEPGGICISEAAYHQVRGRIDIPMIDRGEQRVKNIPRQIRVWSIDPTGSAPPRRGRRRILIPAAAMLVIALVAGGSVALSRGGGDAAEVTTTTTPAADPDLIAVESAAWVVVYDDPIASIVTDGDTAIVALTTGQVDVLGAEGGAHLWSTPVAVGGEIASIQAENGLVVIGLEGSRVVHALDLASGLEAWRSLLELEGIDAVPTIGMGEDSVFVAFGFGLAKLDSATGVAEWTRPLVGNLGLNALSAGRTLVSVGDGRFVYGVEPGDGATAWQIGPPQIGLGAEWVRAWVVEVEGGFSSSYEGRVIVVTGDQNLVVIDGRSGSVEWTSPVSGQPAVSNSALFVAGVDGQVVALSAVDGTVDWTRDDVQPGWPPVLAGESLIVVAGTELLVLNPRSGSTLATIDLGVSPTGPPVPVGGVVVIPFGSTLAAFTLP